MLCAGIVLAGGRSSRMGRPKAALEWHGIPLVARVAGILRRALDGPVVVVRAPGQELPELPTEIEVGEDPVEGQGPLVGIAAGLRAIEGRAPAAFISSTDAPFLHPSFVRSLVDRLGPDADAVVPRAQGHMHPLAAVYRVALLGRAEALIAREALRPVFLFDHANVVWVDEEELQADPHIQACDPHLASLRNLNDPSSYEQASRLPEPEVRIECFGALRTARDRSDEVVRASTLGAAAEACGIELNGHVVAALNGDQISRDPGVPLVQGDVVSLMSADAGG